MQQTAHRTLSISGAVLLSALALGGCATKAFVRDQAAIVDQRVSGVATRLQGTDKTANDALERANAAGKLAEGKFNYTVMMSDDSVKFGVNSYVLSAEAQSRLTELASRLKTDNHNVYIEVQGHADSRETNPDRIGQQRADAVRLFLNKQGVALNRISTISYGKDSPASTDKTKDARALNRRTVIIVMS